MSADRHYRRGDVRQRLAGLRRAAHQDHRQAEAPRRDELAGRGRAAAVLAHQDVDRVVAHQPLLRVGREGAARLNESGVWQAELGRRCLDGAHQIKMLCRGGESAELLPADCEEDAARRLAQSGGGGVHVGDLLPAVAGTRPPGVARQPYQGHAGLRASRRCMLRHARRERMRGIDQDRNITISQIGDEARDAAEPADPQGEGRLQRRGRAPGERQGGRDLRAAGQRARQGGSLARSAENEDAS